MRTSASSKRLAIAAVVAGLLPVSACESPTKPDVVQDMQSVQGESDAVTEPMKIHFRAGSFVVVPTGDPRIPAGSTTDDCPVGQANPDVGLPAGFPNGGGVVVSRGTGEATHLGRFDYVQTQCAIQFFPLTDPPYVNFDLWSQMTGADGSQIFFQGPYARTDFTPPSVPRPTFDIVGGTGRFDGATGWVSESVGLEVTCTDASGLCLAGTFTGGATEGEISVPQA